MDVKVELRRAYEERRNYPAEYYLARQVSMTTLTPLEIHEACSPEVPTGEPLAGVSPRRLVFR